MKRAGMDRGNRKTRRKSISKVSMFLLLAGLLLFIGKMDVFESRASVPTLKVGYSDYNGFIEEHNGNYSGYAVEYLEKIAEYTGWRYEYVYDTWGNCIDKLEKGEIDLICNAQYTQERAQKFTYCRIPIGYESMMLYVPEGSDIYYDDTAAMNHKKVGLLREGFQSGEFATYAKENQLVYEPVYFDTETKIMDAMEKGEIEMAAVGSLAYHENVRAVCRYGAEAFYCMSWKGNEEVTKEIDEALQNIKNTVPAFEEELKRKYYGDSRLSSEPLFTREEHEFIAQAQPVTIKLMKDYIPLSYQKDGESAGMFAEYLKLISEKSGLKFIFETDIVPENIIDLTGELADKNCLVLRSGRSVEYQGLDENLISSNSMMKFSMSYVIRQKDASRRGEENYIFALTKEMKYLENLLLAESEDFRVRYYDNAKECMDAVLHNEADIAIQYDYVVNYLMQKPEYAQKLMRTPGMQLENGMCMVGTKEDKLLISILNKTIAYITSEEENEIISKELLMNPYQGTVSDFLYEYRYLTAGLVVVVLLTGLVYMLALQRMTNLKIKKREYEFLQRQVQNDELTGVYNRKAFYEKAREMMNKSREDVAIVIMDISNFKVVNDLYGVENGDRLLCCIAEELKKLGEGIPFLVSRFSGDHFYMCMHYSDFLKIHFPQHFKTFLTEMDIKAVYGVFVPGKHRNIPINIMCDRASLAVHKKDRERLKYIHYYDEEERKRILEENEMENEMEKALEEHQFYIYVQPKYEIYQGKIIGGEALVRWIHPQKGMVPPVNFIDFFERNGFILRLDYYIWEEACKLLAGLKKEGITGVPISVNVSRVHFYTKNLQEKLENLIAKYQLDPEELELEITETTCVEDTEIIYAKVRKLREAGFKVAMDDFGSGYSSLNMLKEAPLDILKMDLKFLDGGDDIERSHNILETMIRLAYRLSLMVVVEGVETEEQVEFLRGIGNPSVQGYYYSRPVDSRIYVDMLRKERGISQDNVSTE